MTRRSGHGVGFGGARGGDEEDGSDPTSDERTDLMGSGRRDSAGEPAHGTPVAVGMAAMGVQRADRSASTGTLAATGGSGRSAASGAAVPGEVRAVQRASLPRDRSREPRGDAVVQLHEEGSTRGRAGQEISGAGPYPS